VQRANNLANFKCPLSRNFGSLNLLEPSGPVQARDYFTFTVMDTTKNYINEDHTWYEE